MTIEQDKKLKLIDIFRDLDPEISLTAVGVFLLLASKDGVTMQDIGKRFGISQASSSRNVAYLSKYHRLGKRGLDLVIAKEDPAERRRKIITLTPKGKKLVEKLKAI